MESYVIQYKGKYTNPKCKILRCAFISLNFTIKHKNN